MDALHPERGYQTCPRCAGQGHTTTRNTRSTTSTTTPEPTPTPDPLPAPEPVDTPDNVLQRLRENKAREAAAAAREAEQAATTPEAQEQARQLRQNIDSWGKSPTLLAVQEAAMQAQMLGDLMPNPTGVQTDNPVGVLFDLLAEMLGLVK
jgi:hypothetical protein